jgi:hypothetical protein
MVGENSKKKLVIGVEKSSYSKLRRWLRGSVSLHMYADGKAVGIATPSAYDGPTSRQPIGASTTPTEKPSV